MTEPIALLQKLIQINSVNGNELAVAKLLQAELEAADIPTKLIPYTEDRVNLIAELNHGDRVLGFTGHEDVVSWRRVSLDVPTFFRKSRRQCHVWSWHR